MTDSFPNGDRQTPQPPSMHWALLMVLSIVTFGFFNYVWALRQAWFIRKVEKKNVAMLEIALSIALMAISGALNLLNLWNARTGGEVMDLSSTGQLLWLFQILMFTFGILLIRKALTEWYGVRMNLTMTLFLHVFYVQYHMSRIVKLQLPLSRPYESEVHGMPSAIRAGN